MLVNHSLVEAPLLFDKSLVGSVGLVLAPDDALLDLEVPIGLWTRTGLVLSQGHLVCDRVEASQVAISHPSLYDVRIVVEDAAASALAFVECCKGDGLRPPYVRLPSLLPPGVETGHSHPRCFLQRTANCSTKISREHYVSQSILKQFPEIFVSGAPWHTDPLELRPYATSALASNILCDRHNAALSPLDHFAGRAFSALVEAANYAATRKGSGKLEHHLVSGEALELWTVKLLGGLVAAGVAAKDGVRVRDLVPPPLAELAMILQGTGFPAGAGLYVPPEKDDVPPHRFVSCPLFTRDEKNLIGVGVGLGALYLATFIAPLPEDVAVQLQGERRHRPAVIDFLGPDRDASVILSWPGDKYTFNRQTIHVAGPVP